MSAGGRAGAGRGRAWGPRASSEGLPGRTPRFVWLDPLSDGDSWFSCFGWGKVSWSWRFEACERKGCVVASSLGCGPRWGLGWHSQWEESEVRNCFVGRDPALCEMKYWLWDGGLGILSVGEGSA